MWWKTASYKQCPPVCPSLMQSQIKAHPDCLILNFVEAQQWLSRQARQDRIERCRVFWESSSF